jgi:hypothetical protein
LRLLGWGVAKERAKILHDHVRLHRKIGAATEQEDQQGQQEWTLI